MKTKRPTEKNICPLVTRLKDQDRYELHGWFPNSEAAFAYARRKGLPDPSVACVLETFRNSPAELESRLAPWLTPGGLKR